MNKKIALIATFAFLALILSVAIWLLFFQRHSPTPFSKLDVTNLKIDTSSDWSKCYVSFTVYNRHNSPIIAIGQIVNGVNYGYTEHTVPPGQTVDESLAISQLKITNSSNYQIIITFTFDDGYYEDYSQTVYPPKYAGAFSITNQSLTLKEANSTEYSIEIQNTGNIPVTSANFTITNASNIVVYQSDLMSLGNLMPSKTKTITSQPIPYSTFQNSSTFSTIVQVKFADGSTQSTQNSALPVPTPIPTPTPSPTPTPTISPTPAPVFTLNGNLDGGGGVVHIELPVSERQSLTLTATLSDQTRSGLVIVYCWMPNADDYNYLTSGTMTNGLFNVTVKPWVHSASEDSGDWRFRVYWSGDSQFAGVYSNSVTVVCGIP
jgi:hypothetical protein